MVDFTAFMIPIKTEALTNVRENSKGRGQALKGRGQGAVGGTLAEWLQTETYCSYCATKKNPFFQAIA